MELKRFSVSFRLALMAVSLWICMAEAQPPEGHEKAWSELNALEPMTPKGEQALARWIGTWLEPDSWPELPAFLDKQKPATAAGHLWLAEAWDRLAEPAKAASATLAALEKTKGDTSRLRVEAARRLARCTKFDEMNKVLEGLSPDTPVEFLREALRLRWQVGQTQGGTEKLLPALRATAEASKAADDLLPEVLKWESMLRSQGEQKIATLREKLASAKSPEKRNVWRRLLVPALMDYRKMHEVLELAEVWLAESSEGSEDERLAVCALLRCLDAENEAFYSAPAPTLPSVTEMVGRIPSRRPVFQALLTWLIDQGQADEALRLLDQHGGQAFPELRAELLALTDRHAEAVALLQGREDLASQRRAALLMRSLGQSELAARALESRLAGPEATQADHESVLPVMSLLRLPGEVAEWRARAAARFPQSQILRGEKLSTSVTTTIDSVDTRLKEIMTRNKPEKEAGLLRLRRETKGDLRVTRQLLLHYWSNQQHTQVWALARLMEVEADTSAARLDGWREVLWIYRDNASALQPRQDTVGPEFWTALVESQAGAGDSRGSLESYLQKASQASPQDAWVRQLRLDFMLKNNRLEELGMMISADDSASSRLMHAQLLFKKNQPELAAQELLLLATDPALDAGQAVEMGLDMLAWHLFPEAQAFLETQQARFLDDARFSVLLAILHSQRAPGGREEIATLLDLGRFLKEPPPPKNLVYRSLIQDADLINMQQGNLENGMQEIQNMAVRCLHLESDNLLGARLNSQHRALDMILPETARLARAWGTARLIAVALDLPQSERATLAARAAAAGLPHAGLIELGSLSETRGMPMLEVDSSAFEAKLDQPAAASLWLDMHTGLDSISRLTREQQARLPALVRKVTETLQKANWHPHKRLDAARLWLNLEPASIEALKLFADACSLPENKDKNMHMPYPLVLPLELRRRPEWQAAMSRLITAWLASPQPMKHNRAAHGYASIGLWAEAAAQWDAGLEATELVKNRALQLSARPHPPESFPSWLNSLSIGSSLVSPAFFELSRILGAQLTQERHLAQVPEPPFRDQEKVAFLAAADSLKRPSDRAAWVAASGDATALKTAVEAWMKAEPASLQAVTASARLRWQAGAKDEALDMLRRSIPKEPGPAREEARMIWLRAVLFADAAHFDPNEGLFIPPLEDAKQREYASAILREWLPIILKHRHEMVAMHLWQQVYQSCGLMEEAASLNAQNPPTLREQTRQRAQYWSPAPESQDHLLSRLRRDSQTNSSYPKTDTARTASPEKQAELAARWVAALRWQADRRYMSRLPVSGYEMEQTRKILKDAGLVDELLRRVEPGRVRSWRALIHAAHVAEYCGSWASALDLLKEAARQQKPSPVLQSSMILLEQHLTPDISRLAARVLELPSEERKSVLGILIQTWARTGEYSQRLDMADLAVQVFQKEPALLHRMSVGERLSEKVFRLLKESFNSDKVFVPDLYNASEEKISTERAASEALLARRQALHNQMCDLMLAQPPAAFSSGASMSSVLMRYLRSGVPETAAMMTWLRSLPSGNGYSPAAALMNSIHERLVRPDRLKLGRLIMDLRSGEPAAPPEQVPYFPIRQFVEMIGSGQGEGKTTSLLALWESPILIPQGESAHSAEQQAWHREREALFEECCNSALKQKRELTEVFPFWACWALHDEKRVPEVLRVARQIHGTLHGASVLQEMVRMAERSYHKHQHIRIAELVETLLSEAKTSAPTQATTDMLRRLSVLLLAKERDMTPASAQPDVFLRIVPERPNGSAAPPPASDPTSVREPKNSADTTESEMERRKQAVYEKLLKRLADKGAMPPEAVFVRLEQALRGGSDTVEVEKNLAHIAKSQRESFEQALAAFIEKGNARPAGIWESDLRLRWFAAAWRLGRPLLDGATEQMPRWLSLWLGNLMQPDDLRRVRSIPRPAGIHVGETSEEEMSNLYAASPSLAKRDDVFLEVLKVCMEQRLDWDTNFYRYLQMQSWRQPAPLDEVRAVVRARMQENPQEVADGIDQWRRQFSRKNRAFLAVLAEEMISNWPADLELTGDSYSHRFDSGLMSLEDERQQHVMELVPGERFWTTVYQIKMAKPTPEDLVFREQWHRLLDLAVKKDGLLKKYFILHARLHLETAPEQVVEAGKRLLKLENAAESLKHQLVEIFDSEERGASISRRVAWGQVALALLKNASAAPRSPESPVWLEPMLKFLAASPNEYEMEKTLFSKPTAKDLAARDEVLNALRGQAMADPTMAVEAFASHALGQMQASAPVEPVLALARDLMKPQPERLGQQLQHLQQDFPPEASDSQFTWVLNLLVPLAEEWPYATTQPYWLESVTRLFNSFYHSKGSKRLPESVNQYLQRFLTVVLELPVNLQAQMLAYSGYPISREQGVRDWLTAQLINRLRSQGAASMAALLKSWWSQEYTGLHSHEYGVAQVPLKLLQSWPTEAGEDTLAWTEYLLRKIAAAEHTPTHFSRDELPQPSSIGTPSEQEAAQVFLAVLKVLQARPLMPPSLKITQMRRLCHRQTTPVDRERELAVWFQPPLRDKTLAWLDDVFVLPKIDTQQIMMFSEKCPLDANVAEIMDAVRAAQTALLKGWLPTEKAARIQHQVPHVLSQISSMAAMGVSKNMPFQRTMISPSFETETEELLQLWKQGTGTSLGRFPSAPGLPARIQEGLRVHEPSAQLASLVLEAMQKEPTAYGEALSDWAGKFTSSRSELPEWAAAGDFASELASRWSANLPTPDWLVRFVHRWKILANNTPQKDRLQIDAIQNKHWPRIGAILEKYPQCKTRIGPVEEDWFQAVLTARRWTTLDDVAATPELKSTLAGLAASRLKAVPQVFVEIPDLDEKSLSHPRIEMHPALFLLEQALLSGASTPPAEVKEIKTLAPLIDLYFCQADQFSEIAREIIRSRQVSVTHKWLLRVAHLRGIRFGASDWLMSVKESPRFSGSLFGLNANLWLRHYPASENLRARLLDLVQALTGAAPSTSSLTEMLSPKYRHVRDFGAGHFPDGGKLEGPWLDCKNILTDIAKDPARKSDVLAVAYSCGILSQPKVLKEITQKRFPLELDLAAKLRLFAAAGLLDPKSEWPEDFWLHVNNDRCALWEYVSSSWYGTQSRLALKEQFQKQHDTHPTLATALLLIVTSGNDSAQNVPIEVMETALTPCRKTLTQQSAQRLAQLTKALLILQPELKKLSTTRPPDSVLRLLPEAPPDPALAVLVQRWLAMTQETVPMTDAEKVTDPLVEDLKKLLTAESSDFERVLHAGARAFKVTPGMIILELVTEAENGFPSAPSSKWRRALICWLLRHPEQALEALARTEWIEVCSIEFKQRARAHDSDTEKVMGELLEWLKDAHPSSALLLALGLEDALPFLKTELLSGLKTEAGVRSAAEPDNISMSILAWTFAKDPRYRLSRSKQPTLTPSPLANLWPSIVNAPAALRFSLAQMAPESVPAAEAARLLPELATIISTAQATASVDDSMWPNLVSLEWLGQLNGKKSPVGEPLQMAAKSLLEEMNRRHFPNYFGIGDVRFIQQVMKPFLNALLKVGLQDEHLALIQAAARRNILPVDLVLARLRTDLASTRRDLLPHLYQPRKQWPASCGYTSNRGLPELTDVDASALAALDQPQEQAAALFLAALPDSKSAPPRQTVSERLGVVLPRIRLMPEDQAAEALYPMLKVTGLAEPHLANLLPLLRNLPSARSYQEQNSASSTEESKRSPLPQKTVEAARELILWAFAEALYGPPSHLWKDFCLKLEDALLVPPTQPSASMGFFPPGFEPFKQSSPWQIGLAPALTHFLSAWPLNSTSDAWARLLSALEATGPHTRARLSDSLRFFCAKAIENAPDKTPWQKLLESLPPRKPRGEF